MKRLIFALLAFLMLASIQVSAQYVVVNNLGTMINSTAGTSADRTVYLNLEKVRQLAGFTKIDSVVTAMYVENETDVDSISVYAGFYGNAAGVEENFTSTVTATYTTTLDVAAAGKGYEVARSSGATILTSTALIGKNYVKFVTRGATSGNDATDPNKAWLINYVYGTK